MEKEFYSGFVSIIGQPNVGKSTLLNVFVNEHVAITSNKPQTTRNKIQGILTKDNTQIVFIDTPGVHAPKTKLGNYMMRAVDSSLSEIDCVLFLVSPTAKVSEGDRLTLAKLANVKAPVILVINKVDTITHGEILTVIDTYKEIYEFKEIVPISALKRVNLSELLAAIKKYIPAGPQYFPDNMFTDQPEKQIAAEIVREKALLLLQDEIPHGVAVEIISMKKRGDRNLIDMECTIYCEKDSHKGMIIGKNGTMLKNIGTQARQEIARLFAVQINLQLWVKIKNDWRSNEFLVKNMGYK